MTLIGQWNFAGSMPAKDNAGYWQNLTTQNGATFQSGKGLMLGKGNGSSTPYAQAIPLKDHQFSISQEKTLIVWATIDDFSASKPAGSAITIDSLNSNNFDAIVFGEVNDLEWMAGSTDFSRTDRTPSRRLKEDSTTKGQLVKMATTYKKGPTGAVITIYKNDQLIKTYSTATLTNWTSDNVEVLFGVRHIHGSFSPGYFPGTIVAAEIHDQCLSAHEIKQRYANNSTLRVVSVASASGSQSQMSSTPNSQATAYDLLGTPVIEIILDTSGSMGQGMIEDKTYMDVAKDALKDFINSGIPEGTEVALRTFGSCTLPDTPLVPLGPINKQAMIAIISDIKADGLTPIASSLSKVSSDLGSEDGPKVVVLMTDGQETCAPGSGDDIEVAMNAVTTALKGVKALGVDVRLSIIGISLPDNLSNRYQDWAKESGGVYFNAKSRTDMASAIKTATSVYYDVEKRWKVGNSYETDTVASGVVDGAPVTVDADTYTIVFKLKTRFEYEFKVEPNQVNELSVERIIDNR